MKIAMICAVILSATTVGAATTFQNPDHFYVKSTGVQHAAATPVTDFDNSMPLDPAEERASIEPLIQQLEREQSELMISKEGETPDQIANNGEAALIEPMVVYALGIIAYCGYLTVKDVGRF